MTKTELKALAISAIEAKHDELTALNKMIMAGPELGYAEHKTSAAIKARLEKAGVREIHTTALTGYKGWIRGKTSRAAVMLIGELDAVISPNHPLSDPVTGAAHACGHAAQLAVLAGCAEGIAAIAPYLDGDVCFAATPAEEYIQIEKRQQMRKEGKIDWLGGKQQMIAEGAFDDVDFAMMVHAETNAPYPRGVTGGESLGLIGKEIRFTGQEAHAATPWLGVNALNAANLALSAINALRETFRDGDRVRVHAIITKGGDLVNTVPADVRMECHVRAAKPETMIDVNRRVNRAISGCAHALGVTAKITDIPGYYPLAQNPELSRLFTANAALAAPDIRMDDGLPFGGSTDMGDVCWLLPAIQPSISGFTGALHSAGFKVADEYLACILPAKLLTMTVIDLLADGAKEALQIKNAHPRKTKTDYTNMWDEMIK